MPNITILIHTGQITGVKPITVNPGVAVVLIVHVSLYDLGSFNKNCADLVDIT